MNWRFKRSSIMGVPSIFPLVILFTFIANIVSGNFIGFNASGVGWFVPLLFAIIILANRFEKVAFPVRVWMLWILLLGVYLAMSGNTLLDYRVSPLQRTIQITSPLFVGMAASTYRPTPEVLERCVVILRKFAYILFAALIVGSLGQILSRGATGLAAQVMTCMLLGVFFITRYFMLRQRSDLVLYLMMAAMPVLAITRMVIAITLMVGPLSLAPIKLRKRIVWMGLIVAAGLLIFQLPQVQQKMFLSGEGKISEITFGNPDFATTGRSAMWETLYAEANKSPWLGHGTGAGETMTYEITPVGYPHNDWLLTYFDYGLLGVLVFLLSNIYMLLNCFISARKAKSPTIKVFFIASASSFIPFLAVMYTDNIMVYASYFGILQYSLIGLAYGALRQERRTASKPFLILNTLGSSCTR